MRQKLDVLRAPWPYIYVEADGSVWRTERWGRPCAPSRIDRLDGGKGYMNVVLPDPATGRWRTYKAHRLVWEWYYGPIQDGLQVNHRNGKKDDNRIENLELATASENILHSYNHLGRTRPHSRTTEWRGRPRVTQDQVLDMLARRRRGELLREIADAHGISITHTGRLLREKGGHWE